MSLKLFVSDLHIGDGSASDDFAYDHEFSKLLEDVDEADENAELIIIGDGFEILESEAVRQLGLTNFSTLCDSLDGDVIEMIFDKHQIFFDALLKFAKHHKIIYIVGNHDYYILVNDKLRRALLEKLASPNLEIVPHFYDEEFGIFAQHGNQYDVANSFAYMREGYLIPPIGDYITRYTMKYFEPVLRSMDLPEDVIRDYDNVRPLSYAMDWLKYITYIYKLPVDLMKEWRKSFFMAFRSEEARSWSRVRFPHSYWLSDFFTQRAGWFEFGRKIAKFIDDIFKFKETNYLKMRAEKILNAETNPEWKLTLKNVAGYSKKPPDIDYSRLKMVFFGHNHMPDFYIIPTLSGSKYYANTGTWRPLVERSVGKYGQITFHKKIEMNYILVRKDNDEFVIETRLISKTRIN